jgi:hypothetical protein
MNKKNIITAFCVVILMGVIMAGSAVDVGPISCNMEVCSEIQWGYSIHEFDHYDPRTDHTTPDGTEYDPVGQNISPQLIDRLTNEVEKCLQATFPDGKIPSNIANGSYCPRDTIDFPIDRKSFSVMIPNDWVLSCDNSQQLLPTPVESGPGGCFLKSENPTQQCPCRWRAGIRCPNTIICTPNFFLYKDALIRLTTGCSNPWATPEFAKCATPSTTPLSDGSDPKNGL